MAGRRHAAGRERRARLLVPGVAWLRWSVRAWRAGQESPGPQITGRARRVRAGGYRLPGGGAGRLVRLGAARRDATPRELADNSVAGPAGGLVDRLFRGPGGLSASRCGTGTARRGRRVRPGDGHARYRGLSDRSGRGTRLDRIRLRRLRLDIRGSRVPTGSPDRFAQRRPFSLADAARSQLSNPERARIGHRSLQPSGGSVS